MTSSARASSPRLLARSQADLALLPPSLTQELGERPLVRPTLSSLSLETHLTLHRYTASCRAGCPRRSRSARASRARRRGSASAAASLSVRPLPLSGSSAATRAEALSSRSLRLDGRHGQGHRGGLGVARARLVARLRRHRCVLVPLDDLLLLADADACLASQMCARSAACGSSSSSTRGGRPRAATAGRRVCETPSMKLQVRPCFSSRRSARWRG